ncbi:MAG: nickel-dependent lactate racemase [Limnochordia bacterium]
MGKTVEIALGYGKGQMAAQLPEANIAGYVRARALTPVADEEAEVRRAIEEPIGSPLLREIIARKKAQSVAIIVNDITRPTPYHAILPALEKELQAAGITTEQVTFMVATGLHRGHTPEENRAIFGSFADKYRFVNHNADGDLVYLGRLPYGSPLYVNREIVEADVVITTGVVVPHYMAGFAGGRKSILPGVAGRETIQSNHSKMVTPDAAPAKLAGNPIHLEMLEAARRAGVDFIVNVVTDENKGIIKAFAGDVEAAWLAGVEMSKEVYTVPLDRQYDVAITGVGGHPKDINLYQAQKGLENAAAAVKPGGTVILVAQCPEGPGDEVFTQWMLAAEDLEDIIERIGKKFVMGGHKAFAFARVLLEKECILVSDMDEQLVRDFFFTPAPDLATALELVEERHGPDYQALIIPEGSATLPLIEEEG